MKLRVTVRGRYGTAERTMREITRQRVSRFRLSVMQALYARSELLQQQYRAMIEAHMAETRAKNPRAAEWQTYELAGAVRREPEGLSLQYYVGSYAMDQVQAHGRFYEYGTGDAGAASPSPPKGHVAAYTPGWPGIAARPVKHPLLGVLMTELPILIREAIKRTR